MMPYCPRGVDPPPRLCFTRGPECTEKERPGRRAVHFHARCGRLCRTLHIAKGRSRARLSGLYILPSSRVMSSPNYVSRLRNARCWFGAPASSSAPRSTLSFSCPATEKERRDYIVGRERECVHLRRRR